MTFASQARSDLALLAALMAGLLAGPWLGLELQAQGRRWQDGLGGQREPGRHGRGKAVRPMRPGPKAGLSLILGRPTDRSVTVSLLSSQAVEVWAEYGLQRGDARTTVRPVAAGVPCEFELAPLKANTRYRYRLMARQAGSSQARAISEGSFWTQRAPGSTFTFGVQGDSHPEREGKMFDPDLYARTMQEALKGAPDFYLTLGDDFSVDPLINRGELSAVSVDSVYAHQRGFLGLVGHSSPLFLVNGNHEQAARCLLDGTESSPAVLAGRARTRFYPLPAPDSFYTGNAEPVQHVGLPRDYYAWTWGDALFLVLDPYWHSPTAVDEPAGGRRKQAEARPEGARPAPEGERRPGGKRRNLWDSTIGDSQYRWLSRTLRESKARWKFVFCHHVLGTGRGGVEMASLGEWGGRDRRGESAFSERRPGWELPIHELLVKTGVTILFQGHDHLYARQVLDGVVYQSVPNPADPTYQAFNREAYLSGEVLPNSGHLRVTVSPESVRVDYVSSFLPADETAGRATGAIAGSYTLTVGTGGTRD